MPTKRTKIVCTIGPACASEDMIASLVKAGMNVARLNFSHGDYASHRAVLEAIRRVEKATGEPVAILQDLQGPKIRLGILPVDGVVLKAGQMISFDTSLLDYQSGVMPIDYAELHQYVQPGERLLINDGRIETKIVHVLETRLDAEVVVGGTVTSHQGINVPDSHLTVRALTDKDKEDVRFGVVHEVDFIAISFVMGPEDILDVRYLIAEYEKEMNLQPASPIRIIAKIERKEALQAIKEIMAVADGVMVARGDLGVETPAPDVPLVQKRLIDLALHASKPVIVATQMLDSMQNNPRPTRAEVSDVANAVIDHADALMLSNETATGKYPAIVVETMAAIIAKTEASAYDDLPLIEPEKGKKKKVDDIISELARLLAERVEADLILAASLSGETGRMISRYRPELPIMVATATPRVERQLNLSWGVQPFLLLPCHSIEELIERSLLYLKQHKLVKTGDKFIVVAGEPIGQAGHVNLLEVREVA